MVEWAVNADFISVYSPTQLCGGGTTKSNSNELPISAPLFFILLKHLLAFLLQPFLVTLDIAAFHKGYTNHIKHDNQEKEKEIGAVERSSL